MWVKKGRVFHLEPSPNRSTHCQVPTPYVFDDSIRVYYACRRNGMSFPAYFDLSKDLKTIIKVHEGPIMDLGRPGMFDSDGIMPSCIIPHGEDLWMYYIGWNEKSKTARYHNVIGLAVSRDGGETFQRMFDGPIIDRTPYEPGVAVMPFVMKEDGKFKMWYQSGVSWNLINDKYEPVYVIKYAESDDGIAWDRYHAQCINSLHPLEAFSRPSIIKMSDIYSMYYCYRESDNYRGGKGSYKIGHAVSLDETEFTRVDEESVSRDDWDSNMQCYPYIFDVDDKAVMIYNGNDFGQTGIGVALWNS